MFSICKPHLIPNTKLARHRLCRKYERVSTGHVTQNKCWIKVTSQSMAHHGEFAVDPASGAILRISLLAQVRYSFGQEETGVLVEYRPTQIGGRSYICALHSTTIARHFDMFADLDRRPQPIPFQTTLNDVSFKDYRVFGSTSRVVTNANKL